jgi:hypothetical protein
MKTESKIDLEIIFYHKNVVGKPRDTVPEDAAARLLAVDL